VKQICRYLPILSLLLLCVPFASAQSSVDFMLGFGTAHDSANGGGIENANSINAYGGCTPGPASDGFCQANPALNGFFLGFGGDVMLWKHFGLGATASVQPARSNYGPLLYREAFYDFNGIYRPVSTKRVSLELEGGIGGAHTGFGVNESECVSTVVCSSAVEPVGSSNHFDVHAGIGVSLFVTEHIFIRPEFDMHYVPGWGGINNEFNSNAVPMGMVWVGYSFGDR
jgi:hypothetical protein